MPCAPLASRCRQPCRLSQKSDYDRRTCSATPPERRKSSRLFNYLSKGAVEDGPDIDGLSLEALKALVVQLLSKVTDKERVIAELLEENARLKGLNGRPRIKPSGMGGRQ